jgi:predicted DCC family thiol-disulfide oxidoreductase YuxK
MLKPNGCNIRGHRESGFEVVFANDTSRPHKELNMQSIVLIDGVCVLCSRSYRFVRTRDRNRRFRFLAIQQPEGRAIASRYGIDPEQPATFILVEGGLAFVRSEAALRILAELPRWRWTRVLRIIPSELRDRLYDVVARNRYRWFGRLDACIVPNSEPDQ